MMTSEIDITLVVAKAENNVIGNDGALPWHLPEELQRFKAITMGKPILMGRKTWESLPKKPLPGRPNIVVSRQSSFVARGASVFEDLDNALDHALQTDEAQKTGEVCIIGGATLYEQALGRATRIELTEVHLWPEGDVFFPKISLADWRVEAQVGGMSEAGIAYDYITLIRI